MNQIIKTFVCASAVTEFALVAIDSAGKIAVASAPTANTIVGVAPVSYTHLRAHET